MHQLIDEDINGFDDKKFELEQKYAAMFGHGVPGEMFPPGISEDEIMKAVKSCVQNQKDELMKILDVEELDNFWYHANRYVPQVKLT